MARILQTPIINAITPFDPKYDQEISFSYDDNYSVSNRAVITNVENMVVYDKTITQEYRKIHTISANPQLLEADNQYTIKIKVFDVDGNDSDWSEPVLFYCLSTPTFEFTNITDGDTHKNSSLNLDLNYNQSEGEPIKYLQFFQYSSEKTLLKKSDIIYSQPSAIYLFSGLENESSYYFRATGETKNGMMLDTGYVKVDVLYNMPPTLIAFDLSNEYKKGYISLSINVKDVEYELKHESYTLENGTLYLTNDNHLKYFNFETEDNFYIHLDVKKLKCGKFFTVNDDIFSLSILNVCGSYYCELSVSNSDFKQYRLLEKAQLDNTFQSPYKIIDVSPSDDDSVVFEIKKQNGYYDLKTYNKSEL